MTYNAAFDIVRILSILAITIMHSQSAVAYYIPNSGDYVNSSLANALWLLLSLSGYLITENINAKQSPWKFFLRRATRIYAQYILILASYVSLLLIVPKGWRNNVQELSWGKLLRSIAFDFGGTGSYIEASWFLFYVIIFYIIVSISLGMVQSININTKNKYVSNITIIVLAMMTFLANDSMAVACWGSIMGGCISHKLLNRAKRRAIGIGAWLAYLYLMSILMPPVAIGSTIVGACKFIGERKSNTSGIIRVLSNSSYSIYLIQSITIPSIMKLSLRLFPVLGSLSGGVYCYGLAAIVATITCACGIVFYLILGKKIELISYSAIAFALK